MWFDTVSNILPFRTQLKTCSESAMMLPGNDVFKPLTRFLGHRFRHEVQNISPKQNTGSYDRNRCWCIVTVSKITEPSVSRGTLNTAFGAVRGSLRSGWVQLMRLAQ